MSRLSAQASPDETRRTGRGTLSGLALAALLSFAVVGLQHAVHTVVFGVGDTPGGHLAHLLRDGGLGVSSAWLAVYLGLRLSGRPAGSRLGAAATIALLYTAFSVPAVLFHGTLHGGAHGALTDSLEHAHGLVGTVLHALRDSLVGLVAALPLTAAGLRLLGVDAGFASSAGRASLRPTLHRRLRRSTAVVVGVGLASGMLVLTPPARPDAGAASLDPCSTGAAERSYDVSAINLRITLNRFGMNDPGGYMYVRDQDIPAVRAQEASRQVSIGLREDAIQPLVLRANLGECLVVHFTNRLTQGPAGDSGLGGPAPRTSFHALGLSFSADNAGGAVGTNPDTTVAPGGNRTYRISVDGEEGAHAVHPLGDNRAVSSHGLFGTVVAEPAGSTWLDPETGNVANGTNWESIIVPPSGVSFREFVLNYHEIGNEQFDVKDSAGRDLPRVDDLGVYRPASRAINYRSEPHSARTALGSDESQAYGSYAFGDPATPTPRSYLGEPTKTRLLHGGTEMAHVHHLHGGGDRWKRSPGAGDTDFASGLRKTVAAGDSVRLDSQIIEPGEAYSLEHECGAGGCQQVAGDFLFHCHIAHHYLAGMWAFWRVFDTIQPNLATIPGGPLPPGTVTSDGLIGRVIDGKTIVAAASLTNPATQRSVEDLVESELPRQGVRLDSEDATVWDWVKQGTAAAPVYYGEPDDNRSWPNYTSPTPGQRPAILFNPANGRYAWPLLRPHLAKRPPFSPNGHGGAPWLGDTASPTRPDGLCPATSFQRRYDISAITLPIQETARGGVDPDGQIFVLNENRNAVLAGTKKAEPLAIRSNGGQPDNPNSVGDCVAITLSSQLKDDAENLNHSKVNMHTHFVQFDPQASDGVITGFSYEQSIRPFTTENRTLTGPAAVGATTVKVSSVDRLRVGIDVAVGQGEPTLEVRRITAIAADGTLTLDRALQQAHAAGEATGVEFVQYRWFSDVDLGTVFWHDHVRGITSWDHGLFGAHIIEPAGSTYHDPQTGAEVRSGALVDIHTTGRLGADVTGSFREMMVWMHNDARPAKPGEPAVENGDGTGSINLFAEPLEDRGGTKDPNAFSSVKYGDPYTPLPRAYVGDNFVFRVLGLAEKEASLRVVGHRFREERFNAGGKLVDAATVGISERGDYVLDGGAGGRAGQPGDYLYYSAVQRELEDGAWGILRVHDTRQADLQPLPARTPPSGTGFPRLTVTGSAPPAAAGPGQPCPSTAPTRHYDVTILRAPLPNGDSEGVIYALGADVAAIRSGAKAVEPLAIRATAGECVDIVLTNTLDERASLALGGGLLDPQGSGGSAVGFNPDSTVAPGASRTYRIFADRELGTLFFLDLANLRNLLHGAFGALVVEPAGATWRNPTTGAAIPSGLVADVTTPAGSFRELVALFHDADDRIGQSTMPYPTAVEAPVGLNYRTEPFSGRSGGATGPNPSVFSSLVYGDPATTLLRAYPGDGVRIRAAFPAAEQFHAFYVDGHRFPTDPDIPGAARFAVKTIGPGQVIDAILDGGAGGPAAHPGDYLYGDARAPYIQAGLWGLIRVHATPQPDLLALPAAPRPTGPSLATTPDRVDFGDQAVATPSATRVVTVTNRGTAALKIGTLSVVGTNRGDFDLVTGATTCRRATLAPGASCAIGVRFLPLKTGVRIASLSIASNDPAGARLVPLSGTGTGVKPRPRSISLSINRRDF